MEFAQCVPTAIYVTSVLLGRSMHTGPIWLAYFSSRRYFASILKNMQILSAFFFLEIFLSASKLPPLSPFASLILKRPETIPGIIHILVLHLFELQKNVTFFFTIHYHTNVVFLNCYWIIFREDDLLYYSLLVLSTSYIEMATQPAILQLFVVCLCNLYRISQS